MQVRRFARALYHEWNADNITDVAAMMTYYAIFAIFPMLVFLLTIGLIVLPREAISSAVEMAAVAMPPAVADVARTQVMRMEDAAGAGFAIGSAALALWGASRGTASLMSALNRMFDAPERRSWFRRQALALGTTLGVAVLLLLAVALLAVGPAVGRALELGPTYDTIWTIARWAGAAVLVMFVWALLYWMLPDTHAPFRLFTPGAIVGVILWLGTTEVFGTYVQRYAGYERMYGALAAMIVFLTWLWLSNLMLLWGAQINDVLAEVRGKGLTDQERRSRSAPAPASSRPPPSRAPSAHGTAG